MQATIKEHNINTDTVLVPYIIAEGVIRTFLDTDARYKNEPGERKYAILFALTHNLTDKAEKIYQHNESFRNEINNKKKDCREVLAMYMNHWLQAELKRMLKPAACN